MKCRAVGGLLSALIAGCAGQDDRGYNPALEGAAEREIAATIAVQRKFGWSDADKGPVSGQHQAERTIAGRRLVCASQDRAAGPVPVLLADDVVIDRPNFGDASWFDYATTRAGC